MIKHEVIILDSSDKAAQYKTVSGWVSSDGRFFGDNEQSARYAGSTHHTCECGNLMTKGWTKCDECRFKLDIERYEKYSFEEWDGNKPVCDYDGDNYFFSAEDIDEFLDEHDLKDSDLRLVICTPNYLTHICSDLWDDILPEDGEIPKELDEKIDELNKFISTLAPISWSPSKIRTEYKREN